MTNIETTGAAWRTKKAVKQELIDSIADAFNNDELEQLITTRMEDLNGEFAWQKTPMNRLAFELLGKVHRDGRTTELLRLVLKEKPKNEQLRAMIAKHWPDALAAQAPTEIPDTKPVVAAIGELETQAGKNPAVRNVIAASRDKIEQIAHNIDVLFNYKRLHDCLHEIQVTLYPQIVGDVKQFKTSSLAPMELDNYIYKLNITCCDARQAAESLPDEAAVRSQETQWVAKLEAAVQELSKALEHQDDREFRAPLISVRGMLRWEPVRINTLLASVAAKLPLDELAETIKKVGSTIAIGGASAPELKESLDSLKRSSSQLKESVAEHWEWQEVEKNLWEAEDCLERETPGSIEEFSIVWQIIKTRVAALELTAHEKDWAKVTRKHAALIEQGLPDNIDSAKKAFGWFRETALYHFFWVNKELKARCEEILRLREPLRSLLDKV